ncbi:UNVERIFIED_ORG: hypothetical protein CLV66_12742 [Actinomadura viridilutea]|uniref:hypothetical protein n=1 Tax=Actinomadura rubrobrunea TaxID=115335 RepID=UPI00082E36FB|nr:hypothetical protein [Actinomadura rubrobrunea]
MTGGLTVQDSKDAAITAFRAAGAAWNALIRDHQISGRIRRTGGCNAQVMVNTSAWTGLQQREPADLSRASSHRRGSLVIAPDIGCPYEGGAKPWPDPPKSEAGARRIGAAGLLETDHR